MDRINDVSQPDNSTSAEPGAVAPSASDSSTGGFASIVGILLTALVLGVLLVWGGGTLLLDGWNLSRGAGVPGTWYADAADCPNPDSCSSYGIFTQANHDGLPQRLYLDTTDSSVIARGDRLQVNRRYDPVAHEYEAYVGDGGTVGDFFGGTIMVLAGLFFLFCAVLIVRAYGLWSRNRADRATS